MCCRCGDVQCATRDVCRRLEVVRYVLEMLEGMHRVLLCMLEVMRCVCCCICCCICSRLWGVGSVC